MSSLRRVHPKASLRSGTEGLLSGADLAQKQQLIEFLLQCRELQVEKETKHLSALCVLFRRQFGQWKEFALTEIVHNEASPAFCESFSLEYNCDSPDEWLRFEVQRVLPDSRGLAPRPIIGRAEHLLSELLDTSGRVRTTSLSLLAEGFSRPRGHLDVTCELIRPTTGKVLLHVGASKIKKKGFLSKHKPHAFLEVGRSISALHFHPVLRTSVCFKSCDPRWRPFEISLEKLCNSDPARAFLLRVTHAGHDGSRVIGEVDSCLDKLRGVMTSRSRQLVLRKNITKSDKSSKKEKGVLKLYAFQVDHHYTFMDFYRGGCRFNLFVGVDFTLSNGELTSPRSLHDHAAGIYRAAFEKVLRAFLPYLTSSEIRAFGFGAKLPGNPDTSHCFPIAGDSALRTFEQFLEQYAATASALTFSGPTYGCPLLRHVEASLGRAMPSQRSQFYNFLIIFTDGVLNDLGAFKQLVGALHRLPLTVLVVGVGPMDLTALECLDSSSEEGRRNHMTKGRGQHRANSHFFHFKSVNTPNKKLVTEVFAAVTAQMVAFMKICDVAPSAPVLKAVDGVARGSQLRELRESFRRRESCKLTSVPQRMPCPTCGQLFEECQAP